jgi:antitoxin component of RelBE/YafQ-DinJ toxin-antitoxin module
MSKKLKSKPLPKNKFLKVRINDSKYQAFKNKCAEYGISMSVILHTSINEFIRR